MILEILNELKEAKGTNAKKAILEREKENDLLKMCFYYAYDPQVTFYIDQCPEPQYTGLHLLEEAPNLATSIQLVVDNVASRELTGNAALDYVAQMLGSMRDPEAETLRRVILKDLKCGVGAKTANAIWDDLIYIHPYMRCSSGNEKNLAKIEYPAFSQIKADCVYCDIIVPYDGMAPVQYRSRMGHLWDVNDMELEGFFSQFPGKVLQGEALIRDRETGNILPREQGSGYINSDDLPLGTHILEFVLWDMVPMEHWRDGLVTKPYLDRYFDLECVVDSSPTDRIKMIETVIVNNRQEAVDHFLEALQRGEEGTILKNYSGLWKAHTSPNQVKLKVQCDCEFEITEVLPGDPGTKYENTAGRVAYKSSCGQITGTVNVRNDAQRKEFWENKETTVGKIITIRFNDVLSEEGEEGYSLFLPRIEEVRHDKNEADDYDYVMEAMEMIKQGKTLNG